MARVRTFIAVEIGAAVRSAVGALQSSLAKSGAAVKWVGPANLHVTLLFLGEVDNRQLSALCRAVGAAAEGERPFALRVSGVGAFPSARRPKTVWAGIADGSAELTRLHALLEPPLLDLGCYRREERGYTPHLTIGRTKGEDDGQAVAAVLPKHATWDGGTTTVGEVVVFASELRRDGPEYTPLGRCPLKG